MRTTLKLAICLSAITGGVALGGPEVILSSTVARTHLLELYTSEGCSSCPPAEKWVSALKTSPRLWKDFVPVVFHVDYWDGLGWPDRFAAKTHTARQRAYAAAWGSGTVYTPGFVLDGQEWRDRAVDRLPAPDGAAGMLSVTIRDRTTVSVTYAPTREGKWEAHVAVLGFGISSDVKSGENSGRKLLHDFVVLAHETKLMAHDAGLARVEFPMPALSAEGELGVAVWVAEPGEPHPAQAVGGKL